MKPTKSAKPPPTAKTLLVEMGAQRRALRTPEQDGLLLKDIEKMGGDIRIKQVSIWVTKLCDAARALGAKERGSAKELALVATRFWLGLWGTLTELDEHFAPDKMDAQFKEWKIDPPITYLFVDGMKRVAHACIADVRNAMSRDEIIYAEYRRHVEAHPFQDSFRHVHNRNKSGFREVTTIQMLGGVEVPVGDADAAIVRMLRSANVDELQIAVSLAAKLLKPLEALLTATVKYATATNADLAAFRREREGAKVK